MLVGRHCDWCIVSNLPMVLVRYICVAKVMMMKVAHICKLAFTVNFPHDSAAVVKSVANTAESVLEDLYRCNVRCFVSQIFSLLLMGHHHYIITIEIEYMCPSHLSLLTIVHACPCSFSSSHINENITS